MDWKESDARKSLKVRQIVGRMPPMLARYGMAVILASLMMAVFVFAVMPYQPKISVMAKQTINADSTICVHAAVPYELFNNFPAAFSKIQINNHQTEYGLLHVAQIGSDENHNPQLVFEWKGQYATNIQADSATMVLRLGKVPLLFWMMGRDIFAANHIKQETTIHLQNSMP